MPFSGLKILDFTQIISGPLATQLLANSGASVIKVETADGDPMRGLFKTDKQAPNEDSPSFAVANRSKKSLSINLKTEAGVAAILEVAAQCDAFVENFRPGVAQRLGIGYDAVREVAPNIVYCSVSGFGHGGPLSAQGAYDGGIQAVSGMMSTTGHPETGPVRTGYLSVDVPTAMHTAFALSAALLRRERTGLGQHIDVAMMDTALMLQVSAVTKMLHDKTNSGLAGNSSPAHSPLANTFQTKDGYLATSAVTGKHAKAALKLLGLPEEYWDEYTSNARGSEAVLKIDGIVADTMRSETTDHWEPLLRSTGMSVERVNTIEDAVKVAKHQGRPIIDFAQNASEDSLTTSDGYFGGSFIANVDGPTASGTAPAIGEHTAQILAEFGFNAERIDALRRDGAIS
jgi:crotonobetainyl-CoA:carnitine CoA-transferase CaiB-like acyl-CoA transferase